MPCRNPVQVAGFSRLCGEFGDNSVAILTIANGTRWTRRHRTPPLARTTIGSELNEDLPANGNVVIAATESIPEATDAPVAAVMSGDADMGGVSRRERGHGGVHLFARNPLPGKLARAHHLLRGDALGARGGDGVMKTAENGVERLTEQLIGPLQDACKALVPAAHDQHDAFAPDVDGKSLFGGETEEPQSSPDDTGSREAGNRTLGPSVTTTFAVG